MKTIAVFFLALIISASILGCSSQGRVKSKVLGVYFPAKNAILGHTVSYPYDKYGHPVFYFKTEGLNATAYLYEYNRASDLVKKVTVILHRDIKKKNQYNLHYIEIAYSDYNDEGIFLRNRVYRIVNKSDLKDYVKKIEELLKAAQ